MIWESIKIMCLSNVGLLDVSITITEEAHYLISKEIGEEFINSHMADEYFESTQRNKVGLVELINVNGIIVKIKSVKE